MTPADIAAHYRGSGRVYEVFAGLPNPRWRRSPADPGRRTRTGLATWSSAVDF